jgi:hypothetical protein
MTANCTVCGFPQIVRGGDHAEWCERTRAALLADYAPVTECKRGHAFTPENTVTKPNGNRTCRTCKRAAARARYRRKVEAMLG